MLRLGRGGEGAGGVYILFKNSYYQWVFPINMCMDPPGSRRVFCPITYYAEAFSFPLAILPTGILKKEKLNARLDETKRKDNFLCEIKKLCCLKDIMIPSLQ